VALSAHLPWPLSPWQVRVELLHNPTFRSMATTNKHHYQTMVIPPKS
jgi:hypothetical protein